MYNALMIFIQIICKTLINGNALRVFLSGCLSLLFYYSLYFSVCWAGGREVASSRQKMGGVRISIRQMVGRGRIPSRQLLAGIQGTQELVNVQHTSEGCEETAVMKQQKKTSKHQHLGEILGNRVI